MSGTRSAANTESILSMDTAKTTSFEKKEPTISEESLSRNGSWDQESNAGTEDVAMETIALKACKLKDSLHRTMQLTLNQYTLMMIQHSIHGLFGCSS